MVINIDGRASGQVSKRAGSPFKRSARGQGHAGQWAGNQGGMADGAPAPSGSAHLQANGAEDIRNRPDALEPFTGIAKGFLDRVVETIEMGMGFKQGVDQPIGPGLRRSNAGKVGRSKRHWAMVSGSPVSPL